MACFVLRDGRRRALADKCKRVREWRECVTVEGIRGGGRKNIMKIN